MPELVIGIDGGGSKTAACLAEIGASGPVVLGRGLSGPSNLVAVDEQLGLHNVESAIEHAFVDAGISAKCVSSLCLALAGSDRGDVQQRVQHWASSRRLARQIQVVHDAEPLLAELDPDFDRLALICGTGAFAYGRALDGRSARAGGWGAVIGDEGSGYWLGIQVLRAVSFVIDGRREASLLTDRAMQLLQLKDPRDLPRIVAERGRPFIASLSSLVEDAAAEGDELALAICRAAVEHLSGIVEAVAARLSFAPHRFDLVLSGGILLNPSVVASLLDQAWGDGRIAPRTVHRSNDPALGAVRLACRMESI